MANGLDRAVRRITPVLVTIDISAWMAQVLKRDLQTALTFCRLDITELLRVTPKAVQVRGFFSTNIGARCYMCGAILDTEISRASGIGPVCAKHAGIPRAKQADAAATIAHMNELAKTMGQFTVWIIRRHLRDNRDALLALTPTEQNTPPPPPVMKPLISNQVQIAEWLSRKDNLPEVLTVVRKEKETAKWVLFETVEAGKVGLPKSQILQRQLDTYMDFK